MLLFYYSLHPPPPTHYASPHQIICHSQCDLACRSASQRLATSLSFLWPLLEVHGFIKSAFHWEGGYQMINNNMIVSVYVWNFSLWRWLSDNMEKLMPLKDFDDSHFLREGATPWHTGPLWSHRRLEQSVHLHPPSQRTGCVSWSWWDFLQLL